MVKLEFTVSMIQVNGYLSEGVGESSVDDSDRSNMI